MSERRSLFDNSSEQEGSFFEASSSSLMSFSPPSSHQPGGQYSSTGINQFSFNSTVYTPQYGSQTSSIASTKSTGSKHKSYTPCVEWVWGLSPRFPVSLEPGLPLSSASSLNDPILRSFASHTPSGSSASPANSAIGQTAGLNTPSSSTEATESNETDSDEEPSLQEGEGELSSATSEGSLEADILFAPDLDHGHQVAVLPHREALFGLQFPSKFLLSRELLHLRMKILTFA
jgi:hypothetical protein